MIDDINLIKSKHVGTFGVDVCLQVFNLIVPHRKVSDQTGLVILECIVQVCQFLPLVTARLHQGGVLSLDLEYYKFLISIISASVVFIVVSDSFFAEFKPHSFSVKNVILVTS